MIKLVNPIYYPAAVFICGVFLVIGVRFLGMPNLVIIPAAGAIATVTAARLKSREPDPQRLAREQLERELAAVLTAAQAVAEKAETLRQEANQLLTDGEFQIELLVTVQSACDRAIELPQKIAELARRLWQRVK